MTQRISLGETSAADVDVENLPGNVNFVKLDTLLEVPIEVTYAEIAPSDFDPDGKKTVARVQFRYLDEIGEFLSSDEDDEIPNQFSTEQSAIKAQVKAWIDAGHDWNKHTVGPVTVSIYGSANKYGNYPMCLADYTPEIPEQAPVKSTRAVAPTKRDMGEDHKRQLLAGRNPATSSRPVSRPVSPRR